MGIVLAGFWLGTIAIEGRFRKPTLFHTLVLLFFLWNFVSLFWSSDIETTLQRVKTYSQLFLLIFIYWDVFQKPEHLVAGLQAYILGAYVLIASTIQNYLAGNIAVQYEGRYSATGVNANDVALLLILGLPISLPIVMQLFLAVRRNLMSGKLLRIANLVYMPLSIFAVILTGTRTSLIAIIPFSVFMIGTQRIQYQRKLLLLLVLFVFLLALSPFIPQSVIARISTIGDSIHQVDLGGRVNMWRKSIEVLDEHPVLGVGAGAIDRAIGGAVHNTFLSVVSETGFIGLTLFLSILGWVFYKMLRLPKTISTVWLVIFFTWLIGIVSLSWEFRKFTWVMLNFIIIQSSFAEQEREVVYPGLLLATT
jgi:O-antigen ligase